MVKEKIVGKASEREIQEMKEVDYLYVAAKRILADTERIREKFWNDLKKKYKIKSKPEDRLSLSFVTGEIKHERR